MSDETLENDEQPHIPAELREAAERGKKAADENRKLKLELLLAKAGIDTDSGLGGMYLRDLAGQGVDPATLTVDQVQTQAKEMGILKDPEPAQEPAPPVIPDEERQSTQERQALATAAEPPAGAGDDPDPAKVGLAKFFEATAAGSGMERASAEYFHRVLEAAAKGDDRVLFNQQEWNEQARMEDSI